MRRLPARIVAAVAGGALVTTVALIGLPPAVQAAPSWRTYLGTDTGAIPDGVGGTCGVPASIGPPRDVHFAVSNAPRGPLTDVRLSRMRLSSHWIADLAVVLIAPDGTQVSIFGATGQTTNPGVDSSDAGGPYEFADDATASWWGAAATAGDDDDIPSGSYRASLPGGPTATPGVAGSPVSITEAFAGVSDPNGIWTLRFTDGCATDANSVFSVGLDLRITPGCVDESAAASAALAAKDQATTGVGSAQTALTKAKGASAKATAALKKAKKAAKKAKGPKAAKARAKVARATIVQVKAQGSLALAGQRLTAAQAALAAAGTAQTRAADAEASCLDS